MRNPASTLVSSDMKLTTAMLVSVRYGSTGRPAPHSRAIHTPSSIVHPSYISTRSLEQSLESSSNRRTTLSFITFKINIASRRRHEMRVVEVERWCQNATDTVAFLSVKVGRDNCGVGTKLSWRVKSNFYFLLHQDDLELSKMIFIIPLDIQATKLYQKLL